MKLVVVEEGTRSTLEFDQAVIRIGRSIDNDIRLSGPMSSRHHCRIEVRGTKARLIDLGSANGTNLNGVRAEREPVRVGDVVGIGGARIHVEEVSRKPTRAGETQKIEVVEDVGGDGVETLSGTAQREASNLRVFARIAR